MTNSKRRNHPAPNPQTIFSKSLLQPNGCITWQGQLSKSGYGVLVRMGKAHRVHRLIAQFLIENPDNDPYVLHSCDNPPCINPDHLRWGTAKDNAQDRQSRGRGKSPDNRGSKSGNAKLNETQVLEIKKLLLTEMQQKDIAQMFCVSTVTITNIKQGTSWAHLLMSDI